MFSRGPCFSLDKGSYQIIICYSASKEGNSVCFETQSYSGAFEDPGRLALPPVVGGPGNYIAPLSVKEYVEDLELTVCYGGSGELKLYGVTVVGNDFRPQDVLAFGILALLFYLIAGFLFIRRRRAGREWLAFCAVLLLAAASSYPYFSDALRGGDDLSFHLLRIAGIRDGLLSGQFPVRVYPQAYYGAGYGCGLYYPDLFLYFPALLSMAGVSLAASVQIFGFFLHVLAVLAMRFCVRKMGGSEAAGWMGGILYVFCSYFSCNFYCRAAFGEATAMCFFPLVICGAYAAVFKKEKEWHSLCAGMAGLVLSHVLSALFAVLFLFLFCACFVKRALKKDALCALLKAAAGTFGLCAWFLLPFFSVLAKKGDTYIVNMAKVAADYALNSGETLVSAAGGSGVRTIGMTMLFAAAFCLYCVFCGDGFKSVAKRALVACCAGLVSIFCATALFPWNLMSRNPALCEISSLIQYPWRLLGPASAFLSLGAGLAMDRLPARVSARSVLAVAFAVSFSFLVLYVDSCEDQKEGYLCRGDALRETAVAVDYLYLGTQIEELKGMEPLASDGVKLAGYEKEGVTARMTVSAEKNSYVDTTLLYFPGYKARDEGGKELPCGIGENNRLRIWFPEAYEGGAVSWYAGMRKWRVCEIFSLLCMVLFLASVFLKRHGPPSFQSGRV